MEEHTDYIEYERPGDRKVRIVFELYRYEILFHYFEYKHDENTEWKSMTKGDDGYFEYVALDEEGKESLHRIKFPTQMEMMAAQEDIAKKYNLLDV